MPRTKNPDRICPTCGKGKKEDYPLCYTCSMEEKGFVLCECGEKYYDPEHYEKCYDCNQASRTKVDDSYPFDLPPIRKP